LRYESFPGGRLTCGDRQERPFSWPFAYRCCPLLPGRCSWSAGQTLAERYRSTLQQVARVIPLLCLAAICGAMWSATRAAQRRPATSPGGDESTSHQPDDYGEDTLSCGWLGMLPWCYRSAPLDRSATEPPLESLAPSSSMPTIGRAGAIVPLPTAGAAVVPGLPSEAPMRLALIRGAT
jgi:hypothetical protein